MKTCYIIGAGPLENLSIYPDESDFVICADGGLAHARKFGIKPDLVVGDFDSFKTIPENETTVVHPAEKDDTDGYLAFFEGRKRGFEKFVLFGMLGGRLDHTFANYELLNHIYQSGFSAVAFGCGFKVSMLPGGQSMKLDKKDEGIISVFSFCEKSEGISIHGLKYEVENFTMTNRLTRGLSNEFCGKEAEISLESGQLIIFEEDKNG